MKKINLTDLTVAELQQKADEAYQELFNLRFQLSIGRLKNYARISQVRRDIARIKTEQNRRRQSGEQAREEASA